MIVFDGLEIIGLCAAIILYTIAAIIERKEK